MLLALKWENPPDRRILSLNVHKFCSEWSFVGYGTGAFWYLWIRSILLEVIHFPRPIFELHYNDVIIFNRHNSVSNHQPHGCFLKRSFRHRSKKTSKPRVTGLCVGNSPEAGEFPAQMASNAENVSIWWRHHDNGNTRTCPSRFYLCLAEIVKTETKLTRNSWSVPRTTLIWFTAS